MIAVPSSYRINNSETCVVTIPLATVLLLRIVQIAARAFLFGISVISAADDFESDRFKPPVKRFRVDTTLPQERGKFRIALAAMH